MKGNRVGRTAPAQALPPKRWRVLYALLLVVAALVACVTLSVELMQLPDRLGFYGALPRALKAADDHGEAAFVALQIAELAGERDPIAVTTASQCGVLRYYLMPRPVYVLPEAPSGRPDPAYLARHRQFLEERGVRWLLWVRWEGRESWRRARLHDAAQALRGAPGPGVRLWCTAGWERPTRAGDYLVACLVLALVVALGWAIRPLVARDAAMTWAEALPRDFALGLLALHTALSSLMLGGVRMSRWVVVGACLGLAVALAAARLLFIKRRRSAPAAERPSGGTRERRGPKVSFSPLRAVALAVCVAAALAVAVLALVMPVRNVDAVHHWGYAAKVFHYEGGVWNPVYFDAERGYVYGRYPVLVPVALFTMYEAMGRVEDQAAKVLFPAFFAMLLLALLAALWRERPGTGALLVIACVACCAGYLRFEGGAVSALADVPLSLFLLLGLVEWRRWAEGGERGRLVLWVLFLCAAAVTKLEGAVALALALAAAGFVRRRVRPVPWRRVGLALGCVAALVLPWYGFARLLPEAGGFVPAGGSVADVLPRNLAAAGAGLQEFLAEAANMTKDADGNYVNNWGALWLLVLAAVALGWRRASAACRVLVAVLLLQVAAYVAAYLLTPLDPRGLVATTKMRLLLQLAPAAAYLAWCFLPPLPRGLDADRRPK